MLTPNKNLPLISYIILSVLSVISFVIYFNAPSAMEWDWLRHITVNLGTGIIVALLTVLLIDNIIRINREKERKKYQSVALRQLQIPLIHQFHLLFYIFKSSVEIKPQKTYQYVRDLFDDNYFVQLAFFDFSKKAPIWGDLQWFDYLPRECTKFRDALSRTVEKYSLYLDSGIIEIMEEIINSDFISIVLQAPAIREIDRHEGYKRSYNFFAGSGMCDIVREYTSLFTRLVEHYNELAPQEKRVLMRDDLWRNDTAPKIGSGRVSHKVT
jgi:hypothetical protein